MSRSHNNNTGRERREQLTKGRRLETLSNLEIDGTIEEQWEKRTFSRRSYPFERTFSILNTTPTPIFEKEISHAKMSRVT